MKSIFVEAQVKIVSTAQGKQLHEPATITVEHDLSNLPMIYNAILTQQAFFAQIEASIREQAKAEFIKYIRANPSYKRRIGGTAWSVQLVGDVMDFPIYLDKASVGTVDNHIKPGAWRRNSQIQARNLALFSQIFQAKLKEAMDQAEVAVAP